MIKRWIMLLLVFIILVDIMAGVAWTTTHYFFVSGSLYARDTTYLDLSEKSLTVKEYLAISENLPDCEIIWTVPLSDGGVPNTETSVKLAELTEADIAALQCMPNLKTVDASECENYPILIQLQEALPDCKVQYQVRIAGKAYPQNAKSVTASGFTQEDAQNLSYLPQLSRVTVSNCEDYSLLQQIQKDYPQWNLSYTVQINDKKIPFDTETVTVTNAVIEDLEKGIPGLPNLTSLQLINPDAHSQDLLNLRAKYPKIQVQWQVEFRDKVFTEDVTELDISGIPVKSCEEVEKLVACLPNLEKLIMSDCGIDSKTMAAFRERQRENYKVVWTVYLSSKAKCRTDDTYFMPIKQGEYYLLDQHTEELKYCEDMVCIDVGHHKIHNIDFVAYMPKLKYLVIAHTEVQDISPIVNCQELIYLEVDWSTIRDCTPIAQLKKLEDLNMNQTFCDLTPLMEMTWLKHLWIPGRGYAWGEKLKEALPNTIVVTTEVTPDGVGWRNLQNYYDMRDYLGMHYMK